MIPRLIVLLALGFCLDQKICAQNGIKPSIWAVPDTVVPQHSSVTILCSGPTGMTYMRLQRVESQEWDEKPPTGAQEVVNFSFQKVTQFHARTYYCSYMKEGTWSRQSDPLKLVVTGVFKGIPYLTAHPGPRVTLGGNVTLLCHSDHHYDSLHLYKDGRKALGYFHQDRNTFLISPVTLTNEGIYTCYGSSRQNPLLWSLPSKPLDLVVTGAIDGETKNQVKYNSSSPSLDVQEENQYATIKDIQPEEYEQMDTQVRKAEDPKEVTYAVLQQENLMRSVDVPSSCTLRDASQQPCVYATLTLP